MRIRPTTRPWRAFALCLVAGLFIGFFSAQAPETDEPVSIIPLLSSIQSMGQLHAVRYNMHDIVEHERKLEPKGVFRALPGAAELYGAVTKNRVVVKAQGGVEAGVDLSQVGPESVTRLQTAEGPKFRIRLPRAQIYTPDVQVSVVKRSEGLFWKDMNLVPRATRDVQQRFTTAALESDILEAAEKNAVETLSKMVRLSGADVEFYF